jgi:hypothetical protein
VRVRGRITDSARAKSLQARDAAICPQNQAFLTRSRGDATYIGCAKKIRTEYRVIGSSS